MEALQALLVLAILFGGLYIVCLLPFKRVPTGWRVQSPYIAAGILMALVMMGVVIHGCVVGR